MLESMIMLCLICKIPIIMMVYSDNSDFHHWCGIYPACTTNFGTHNIIFIANKDMEKYSSNDLCGRTVLEHEVYRALNNDFTYMLDGCHDKQGMK